MAKAAFSVRIDRNKVEQLDALSKQMERSRNYLVNQAIDQFLEMHPLEEENVKETGKELLVGGLERDIEVDDIFREYEA